MRERRKEPREGSEIDPETTCIQTVGAPASSTLPGDFVACSLASNATKDLCREGSDTTYLDSGDEGA